MAKLTASEHAALALFKQAVERIAGQRLVAVLLFGSKARGDSHAESDVDVLVELSNVDAEVEEQIVRAATDILVATGAYIAPSVYSTHQLERLRRDHSLFVQAVVDDAIAL